MLEPPEPNVALASELGAPSEESAASSSDSDAVPVGRAGRWARAALCVVGAAIACGLLLLGGANHWSQRHRDAGSGVVGLSIMDALEDILDSAGEVIEHGLSSHDDLTKLKKEFKEIEEQLVGEKHGIQNELAERLEAHGPLIDALKNGSFKEWAQDESNHEMLKAMMKHHNDLQDGNFCEDDEEQHASLCYKKCSDLDPEHPVRCSAFSCARESPCTPFNSRFVWKICGGFDIAGDSSDNACPHQRGACYADEELHLNRCYKKCALLTDGEFNWRSAAETCCKYKGVTACLEAGPGVQRTSADFGVGGGDFESNGIDTSRPHPPVPSEAEKP